MMHPNPNLPLYYTWTFFSFSQGRVVEFTFYRRPVIAHGAVWNFSKDFVGCKSICIFLCRDKKKKKRVFKSDESNAMQKKLKSLSGFFVLIFFPPRYILNRRTEPDPHGTIKLTDNSN